MRSTRRRTSPTPGPTSIGLDLELNGRQQDGTELPVKVCLSPIDTGGVLLVITATDDVTERQRTLENAQRMTAIVENSNDAIIAKTLDGIISSWNRSSERMYGYSSEEIIGKSIEVLCPNERTGEIETILAKIRAGQHVEHLQTIRIRKDGTALPVSLTVSPIRDADGAIIGASTTTHDVTQSRQAIESGRSMIESSLDSLVAISPQGMITDVNEATVKVTGIPRAELIGTAFSDCFTEPEKANAIYQLVFEQGMAVDYPLTMRHRDGALTEVLYNASVYRDGGGKVLGVFAAARDVTKQHWAQQQVAEQQAKALERLAELENFQRLTVGRELKMIELKKQIAQLQMYGPAGANTGTSTQAPINVLVVSHDDRTSSHRPVSTTMASRSYAPPPCLPPGAKQAPSRREAEHTPGQPRTGRVVALCSLGWLTPAAGSPAMNGAHSSVGQRAAGPSVRRRHGR